MKKQLLFAALGLLFGSQLVKADEIKLTSSSAAEIKLGLTTSQASTVSVDWGNGTPVNFEITQTDADGSATEIAGVPSGEITITGNGITVFDCSGSSITALDVTKAENLIKLSFNNNEIKSIDLSQNKSIYTLHAEKNVGLDLDVTNITALTLFYCNDNESSSLDVSKNLLLKTLNINNNRLTSIDLSKNTALTAIYATTNLFESIDVSKNTSLTYLSLIGNKLTSINVTMLAALKSLFIANNNLNFATLPKPGVLVTKFTYAPQQAYVLDETIATGVALDLSSLNNVKGILTEQATTVYQWATEGGVALVKDIDYTEVNGVFTFLKEQSEKIVCSMTTPAYPLFSAANVFKTTPITVFASSSIDNDKDASFRVTGGQNVIVITGLPEGEFVRVANLQGQVIYNKQVVASDLQLEVRAGIYVVYSAGESYKVVIK